jgi:putative membrane protein
MTKAGGGETWGMDATDDESAKLSEKPGQASNRRLYCAHLKKNSHAMLWLWIKAFHVVFVVTWFAGLFYLPRLFINDAESSDDAVRAQLRIMQRRLLGITHIGGALALTFGVWTLILVPGYLHQAWLHAKLALVLGLIAYHACLMHLTKRFAAERNTRSSRWLRVFNEVPALFLIAIVLLAVLKPF